MIQQDFKIALQEVDLLISPVAPTAAYKIGINLFYLLHLSHSNKLHHIMCNLMKNFGSLCIHWC